MHSRNISKSSQEDLRDDSEYVRIAAIKEPVGVAMIKERRRGAHLLLFFCSVNVRRYYNNGI